jgi:hypothetical protein
MKTTRLLALYFVAAALNLLFAPALTAQTKARIDNVDFTADADKISINYDIIDSQADETFYIWIQVQSASGKLINAKSTSGDIGKGVKGGFGKKIEWNYKLDKLDIEDEISIEVFATSEIPGKKTEEPAPVKPQEKTYTGRKISVGEAMLFSALLPGLGKVYVKGHGANWMWGVVGYGFIAGSVLMNHAAYDNLEAYRASYDPDERDDLYSKAQGQAVISYVFAGGAITIWVIDFISTGVKAGKAKRANQSRVQFNGGFDPKFGTATIGLAYRF